ncbi:uncharacterized protein ARMOST_09388 [Armillaria ostoyae]|uniref:Uncharacterized protein n=1 Tax=Armillaria ostoyae TaxID=47428 RepID=A0A284RBC7_ARMOS|nr:uncharacterized protein ARMOST_09388 [Armillaria ostoyae]
MTSMPASAPLPMSLDEIKKLANAEARDLHPVKVTTKNLEKKQAQLEEFLSLLPKAGQSWVSTVKGLPKLQDPVREVPTKKMRTMPTLVNATPADSQTLMDYFYYWEPTA